MTWRGSSERCRPIWAMRLIPRKSLDESAASKRGVPAEDEFGLICAWLGQRRLLHKLDQQHAHAD
jgi:hypothetical protein